jgi:hypothetical protein
MYRAHLSLLNLNNHILIERFYTHLHLLHTSGLEGPLFLDLSSVSFVPPHGLLALVTAARLWHRWTGNGVILGYMQPKVHRYLERMDLFTTCASWIEQDNELPVGQRFDRSPESVRLLEVMRIASEEDQNARDVVSAVQRAQHIITAWFHADEMIVGRLITILCELATNVAHSRDQGFVLVQRYADFTLPSSGSRMTVAIADLGIGIQTSLSEKFRHMPSDAPNMFPRGSDYLYHALQLGVTSRDVIAGTGLYRVNTIVNEWQGSLTIRSARSMVHFEGQNMQVHDDLADIPGTHISINVRGSFGI